MSGNWCRSLETPMYNLTPLHLSTKCYLARRHKQRDRHWIKTVLRRGRAFLPFTTQRGARTQRHGLGVTRGDGCHPLNRPSPSDFAVSLRENIVNPTHSGRSLFRLTIARIHEVMLSRTSVLFINPPVKCSHQGVPFRNSPQSQIRHIT